MDDSVFRGWAEQLRRAGKEAGNKPHVELVELIRAFFPPQKMRYQGLWNELHAVQTPQETLVAIGKRYVQADFTAWFDGVRGGNAPEFRALLLKWLWNYRQDAARDYLSRWGIEIPKAGNDEEREGKSASLSDTLTLTPADGLNVVYLGEQPNVENAQFSFAVTLTIQSGGASFTLLGFRARYIAADGCYCLSGPQTVLVNEVERPTAGNDLDFITPMRLENGVAQVRCVQALWPPVMTQTPQECALGDLQIEVRYAANNGPELLTRFFRFEADGNLTPIEKPREIPILSDSTLQAMRDRGAISDEDFTRASLIKAKDRYRVAKFRGRIKRMDMADGSQRDVMADDQAFLMRLYGLQQREP